jgi:hypothetical protein
MPTDSAQVLVRFSVEQTLYEARFRQSANQVEFVPVARGEPEVRVPARSLEEAREIAFSYLAEEWPDSTVH